jgi:hypothetical protein
VADHTERLAGLDYQIDPGERTYRAEPFGDAIQRH